MAVAAIVAVASSADAQKADAAQVAGTWNMTVKGPAAHGDMAATLVLSQKDGRLAGTLSAHGNEHTLMGEYTDGTLTLVTTDTPEDKRIELNAKVQDNGSLAGYLSGPMGDMQWTATRAGDRR
jgi:hypothetical protein